MKKIIIITALACLNIHNSAAQTNNSLSVFTEGGERFFLILNGVRQNTTSETSVKATGLNGMQFKAKIIFEQKGIPDCDKNIPMMWEAEQVSNTEFVYSVSKDKKGNYKWKFVSKAPITMITTANSAATTTNTVTTNTNAAGANTGVSGTTTTNVNNNVNTTTSSTTTTTSGAAGTGATGVNMNLGVNGVGMNVSVNVNDGTGTNVNSTTTTTTTTSYTTTTTTGGVSNSTNGTNTQLTTGNNVNAGNNTTTSNISGKCGVPMLLTDYNDAKNSIKAKSFEDTKLSMAKQIADNNCLDVTQIKGIIQLFSFEETKLDFAKYCYDGCYDKKNYFKLNDAFTFDSSTTELNDYIKGK